MGLFGPKYRQPNANEKKEINGILGRIGTVAKKLDTTDSIDKLFTEWEKYLADYNRLLYYEQQRIKFTVPPSQIHAQICAEMPRIEIDVVNRGYDRMLRDCAKVSTEKAKKNKATKFFNELEFYFPRLQVATVQRIQFLKAQSGFFNDAVSPVAQAPVNVQPIPQSTSFSPNDQSSVGNIPSPVSMTPPPAANTSSTPNFCSNCGAPLEPGNVFCGKCGNRV